MKNNKKVVLLVDDSILLLERMIPMLEESPSVQFVIHAGNYQEAAAVLGCTKPDLILLDIQLPGESGLQLLEMVQKNYSHIPVFMMTNHDSQQYREACKRLGAQGFFDKSKDFDRIPEAIAA
jgi:DNA-binding NarL/FixJ family response regulator